MPLPLKAIYDVAAPAKLNLFLHITGRRPDGYHLIQSVFMLIDWCDTLHFDLRRDGVISRSDLPGSWPAASNTGQLPADDLSVRAARALQQACGTPLGVHIGLQKRIPSQAGMGGGSSDAASTLLALQHLWGVHLPSEQLHAIALKLGADVPFFLSGGHAWVEGVGERITPMTLASARFVVIKPASGLATQTIFNAPTLKRDTKTATIEGFAAGEYGQKFIFGRNDLQPVAQEICPPISQCLDWLTARQLQGRMTGSGSAVFAHVPEGADMADLAQADTSQLGGCEIRQCSNLEMHPLAGW